MVANRKQPTKECKNMRKNVAFLMYYCMQKYSNNSLNYMCT